MIQAFFSQLPPLELNAFWISQILVGLAFLSDSISWQLKKREFVLIFLTISCALIGTHYLLLKEYAGVIALYIASLRYFVSIFTTQKIWMWIFMGLVCVGTYFVYKSTTDFLILIANIIFNIAAFRPKDKQLREWVMIGMPFLILYNILIFTPVGVLLEVSFLISNIIGYWRFYLRKH